MSRDRFETDQTKAREQKLGEYISSRWNCELQKLAIKYRFDCLALRDDVAVAWIELRCRENPMLQYPTYMISLHKVQGAKRLEQDTNLPAFLVVEWTDKVGYVNLAKAKWTLGFGGMTKLRDWQDREPVCYIPIEEFEQL